MTDYHRALGHILWEYAGMSRTAEGLQHGIREFQKLRQEFWCNLKLSGTADNMNQDLEHAGRVADYLEFGELLIRDALDRDESCGAHFREEHQSPDGEALRDDEDYSYVAAWEYKGDNQPEELHKEELVWDEVHPTQRNYA